MFTLRNTVYNIVQPLQGNPIPGLKTHVSVNTAWVGDPCHDSQIIDVVVAAYRTSLRQLRQAVSSLQSFVTNHLQYQRADDVRLVNSVTVHFESLVSRLVYTAAGIMDRFHLSRHRGLVMYGGSEGCGTVDPELLLAADVSKLLSQIRTASHIISLTTWLADV